MFTLIYKMHVKTKNKKHIYVINGGLAMTCNIRVALWQNLHLWHLKYRQNSWNDVQCSNKCGKTCNIKPCMWAKPAIHKGFRCLIGQTDILHYDVTSFPTFCLPTSFRTVRQTGRGYIICQINQLHFKRYANFVTTFQSLVQLPELTGQCTEFHLDGCSRCWNMWCWLHWSFG